MPYLLLAIAAGVLLASLSNKDKASIERELKDAQDKLDEARANQANKADLEALATERDDLKRRLASIKAGQRARGRRPSGAKPKPAEDPPEETPPEPLAKEPAEDVA